MPVYLDNSATTRVCEEVIEKMTDVMRNHYGNPSSLHSMGLDAELIVTDARKNIADALRCKPAELIFTSGGTEANNLAIFGAARSLKRRGNRIVTTSIEHPSVLSAMRELEKSGFEVVYLSPSPSPYASGAISADELFNAVTPETVLVSIMLVNNETGAVQPVEAAKKAIKKAGSPALVHCDAVQGFCKVSVRPEKLGVDLLTISSHKIHGPKGAGALYVRNGAHILPMLFGGGQEKGMRSGTEAVPAIAGFGEAARLAYQNMGETESITSSLRNYCIERLSQIPGVIINSPASGSHAENMNSMSAEKIAAANCSGTAYCPITTTPQYAPHILNISVLGIRSETMLHFLESEGIFVSSGSACSKGAKSHVLSSMKLSNEIIDSALRISFCRYNTIDEINALIEAVERGSARLVKQ